MLRCSKPNLVCNHLYGSMRGTVIGAYAKFMFFNLFFLVLTDTVATPVNPQSILRC